MTTETSTYEWIPTEDELLLLGFVNEVKYHLYLADDFLLEFNPSSGKFSLIASWRTSGYEGDAYYTDDGEVETTIKPKSAEELKTFISVMRGT